MGDAATAVLDGGRVLFALLLREMATRYGRSPMGYVWAIAEPVAFIAIMSLIFSEISQKPPLGTSFPLFYATGYMAFHFYIDISSTVSQAIAVNKPLLSLPRITMLDVVLARFLLQWVTCWFVTVLIIGGILIVTEHPVVLDLGAIFTATTLAALLGLGVGGLNCVLFALSRSWQQLFGIVNRPLFVVSGVFFTYEGMPHDIQAVLWWNPLVHVTALMRSGFYGMYDAAFASVTLPLTAALMLMMLVILLVRVFKARMIDE